ncbi:hypothetical protein ACVWXO_000354 [Bradyrhizobium sp. LM2.7]
MPVRFLISTLKEGVDPAEYEAWVRERDYALVRSLDNYVSYKVHRIRRPIQGAENSTWQYIERIEVKSLEQHDKDLASPAGCCTARGALWQVSRSLEEHLFRQR